jgi:hypothetical protein
MIAAYRIEIPGKVCRFSNAPLLHSGLGDVPGSLCPLVRSQTLPADGLMDGQRPMSFQSCDCRIPNPGMLQCCPDFEHAVPSWRTGRCDVLCSPSHPFLHDQERLTWITVFLYQLATSLLCCLGLLPCVALLPSLLYCPLIMCTLTNSPPVQYHA